MIDHFRGPDRALGCVCVRVCVCVLTKLLNYTTFDLDMWFAGST